MPFDLITDASIYGGCAWFGGNVLTWTWSRVHESADMAVLEARVLRLALEAWAAALHSSVIHAVGDNQGVGDVEYGGICDIYVPPEFLRLFDGPSCNIMDMTNVDVCTTGDFAKCVGALVCYIDPENEECKIAYPNLLSDHNIIDGRGMMCSVLTQNIGSDQGTGGVELRAQGGEIGREARSLCVALGDKFRGRGVQAGNPPAPVVLPVDFCLLEFFQFIPQELRVFIQTRRAGVQQIRPLGAEDGRCRL
jgi:hypothetical protein